MNETTKIPLSKLLKLEVPQFTGHVVRILNSHNPEKLHLEGMYKLLLDQQSNAALLIDRYGPHDLTEPLNLLHAKRLGYASMIVSKLHNLDKRHFRKTLDLVRTARPMVRYHLAYLGQQKRDTAHECIRALFIQLDEEPQIMEAMVALGFLSKLDKLKEANLEHEKLWMARLIDKAKRPKVDTREVMKEVEKVLRWFFDQVDTCQKIYKEVDYGPLINELNVLSSRYSTLFSIREGVNKRKREKAKEAKEKETK